MPLRLTPPLPVLALLTGLTACTTEVSATPAALQVSPLALDFGSVPIDETASLSLSLSNPGDAPIALRSATLVQGSRSQWSLRHEGALIQGGESVSVEVFFSPTDTRRYPASLLLRTSFGPVPRLTIPLIGEGAVGSADNDGDGFKPTEGDCDDANPEVYPGAPELCNGRDDNCDGLGSDERDNDGDGYTPCQGDCIDGDPTTYPGAAELCDAIDNDCDGVIGDLVDADADGQTPCEGDCDDDDPDVNSSAVEVCDGRDTDCNNRRDDLDADGDGHSPCSASGDCDDDDASAYPLVVDAGASPGGDGTESNPLDSLAAALAALDSQCRSVYLLPGSHPVSDLLWSGGRLSLIGVGTSADDVVLSAAAGARHLIIDAGAELSLRQLSLSGGSPSSGDGGSLQSRGQLDLEDVVLSGNNSLGDGGAIWADGGSLSLVDVRLEANSALGLGGALYVGGASLLLRDSLLLGNSASEGGGLALVGAGARTLVGNRLWSNDASGDGGGLLIDDADAGLVRNNLLQDNLAGGSGGGLAARGVVNGLSVENNTLHANQCNGEGGGIALLGSDAAGSVLSANLLLASGGLSGLYAPSGSVAQLVYNTASGSVGLDLAGEASVDPSNTTDPVGFVLASDDGDPSDDDLHLLPGDPAIDSGPPDSASNDPDGSRNDRGAYGGPEALP